jgi:FkbM family methyltransferase
VTKFKMTKEELLAKSTPKKMNGQQVHPTISPELWDLIMEQVRERVCDFLSRVSVHYDLNEIKTIFDVGSLNGVEAYYMAQLLPQCKIWSFEANSDSAVIVKSNHQEFSDRLYCVNKAVSNYCGKITFYTTPQSPGCDSALKPIKEGGDPNSWLHENTIIVPVEMEAITLESFCIENGISNVDLIWMDVQGGEIQVIDGLGQLKPKAIFTETGKIATYYGQGLEKEITDKLSSMGYTKQNREGLLTYDHEEDNLYIIERTIV